MHGELVCWITIFAVHVLLLYGAAASSSFGGSWCVRGTSPACTPLKLRFRPLDGTIFSSYVTEHSQPVAVIGRAMPLIAIQVVSIADDSLFVFTGPITVSASISTSSLPSISVSGTTNAAVGSGNFFFYNLKIDGTDADGATTVLNFTTTSGLWLTSPVITVRLAQILTSRNPDFHLQFAKTFSYFTPFYSAETVTIGVPLPDITVAILDPGDGVFKFTSEGDVVSVRAEYVALGTNVSLNLASAAITTSTGTATFSGLTLSNVTVPNVQLRFIFSYGLKILKTDTVKTVQVPIPCHQLAFAPLSQSFLTNAQMFYTVQAMYVMQRIVVELQNSAGAVEETYDGVGVTVSCETALLDPSGTVAMIRNGRAIFDDLRFDFKSSLNTVWPLAVQHILTFTAGTQGAYAVARKELLSPAINMTKIATEGTGIRFAAQGSAFSYPGQTATAVVGVLFPPVVVEVFDGNSVLYTLNHAPNGGSVTVSAQSQPDTSVVDAPIASLVDGRAIFDELVFTKATQISLKFSIVTSSFSGTLTTGLITIFSSEVQAVSMRFDPNSYLTEEDGFATKLVAMPAIVIEILDASGYLDTKADDVVITASSPLYMTGTKAVSYGGKAVFPSLTFGVVGNTMISFKAFSPSGQRVSGMTLRTGFIEVEESVVSDYALTFHPNGAVQHEGQPVLSTAGEFLPPIGVCIVSSTNELQETASNLKICATTSAGTFSYIFSNCVNVTDGVAWFKTLRYNQNTSEPIITFRASHIQPPTRSSVVAGKLISTGPVYFVGSAPTLISIVVPDNTSTYVDNSTDYYVWQPYVGDATRFNEATAFHVAVGVFNASGDNLNPPSATLVTVQSSCKLSPTFAPIVQQPSCGDTGCNASFHALRFISTDVVDGLFYTLTFTTAWPATTVTSALVPPLYAGPFYFGAAARDSDEQCVVAEVLESVENFNEAQWVSDLASAMHVSARRIEIMKIRRGGSAVSGRAYLWQGTRVEFKFTTPTTQSEEKGSSLKLVQMFLGLGGEAASSCSSYAKLKIRKAYLRSEDTSCDLYRLDEQFFAVKRCVSVSPAEDRCACHVPLFETLGDACKSTTQLKTICASVQRCARTVISDACQEYEWDIIIQYGAIVIGFLGLIVSGAVWWLWRVGWFARLKRAKLKDVPSVRMARHDYGNPMEHIL